MSLRGLDLAGERVLYKSFEKISEEYPKYGDVERRGIFLSFGVETATNQYQDATGRRYTLPETNTVCLILTPEGSIHTEPVQRVKFPSVFDGGDISLKCQSWLNDTPASEVRHGS